MTPNVISVLGGPQVFGARAARVDLLEEVERGLPVRAYEAVSEALDLTPIEEDRLLSCKRQQEVSLALTYYSTSSATRKALRSSSNFFEDSLPT